jgi:hypothetical protein
MLAYTSWNEFLKKEIKQDITDAYWIQIFLITAKVDINFTN